MKPLHVGEVICSNTIGNGSCFFPGSMGDNIYSEVTGDGWSIPCAMGNGICANATGGGSRGRSPAEHLVTPHGSPCNRHGNSSKPSHTDNRHLL